MDTLAAVDDDDVAKPSNVVTPDITTQCRSIRFLVEVHLCAAKEGGHLSHEKMEILNFTK